MALITTWTRQAGGSCSFCTRAAGSVPALLGAAGGLDWRICSDCVAFSLELRADVVAGSGAAAAATPTEARCEPIEAVRARLIPILEAANVDPRIVDAHAGRLPAPEMERLVATFTCSFCGSVPAKRFDLVPSATTSAKICATCLGEASAVASAIPESPRP